MDIGKLVTLTFEKNVGASDRVFRLLSGTALALSPLAVAVPTWAAVLLTTLGLMWTATGVLSKCTIYYLLGYSSCPAARDE